MTGCYIVMEEKKVSVCYTSLIVLLCLIVCEDGQEKEVEGQSPEDKKSLDRKGPGEVPVSDCWLHQIARTSCVRLATWKYRVNI